MLSGEPLSASTLFNGYVGASVIHALQEIGALELLARGEFTIDQLAEQTAATTEFLSPLLKVTQRLGYLEESQGCWGMTAEGLEVMTHGGFFGWLIGGYGELFQKLGALSRGQARYGQDVKRDEAAVALNSGRVDKSLMEPILYQVLDNVSFSSCADVGCGSARRLISLCQRYPSLRGVGIDISTASCRLAEENVRAAGLEDRIDIICADLLQAGATVSAEKIEHLRQCDLVSSFMMLHDLMSCGGEGPFGYLREAFPNARRYLIADTVIMPPGENGRDVPIFALGFELAHSFMATQLYRKEDYEELFEVSGLRVELCVPFGAPNTWLYLLEDVR